MRRYHPIEQIIGERDARVMTRNILRSDTCLVSMHEPKIVKKALNSEDWIQVMNDKIYQIEKNKT